MLNHGKKNVLGVLIDAVDYDSAVERIAFTAKNQLGTAISALAVHGVMTGVTDPVHRHRLNSFDLVVPDGQPVRWALNLLHGASLTDRVYGPRLMLEVCRRAAAEALPIYLYGSQQAVLEALSRNLQASFPQLKIAGMQPSRFRQLDQSEKDEVVRQIRESGAAITFVGLGCPRQEVWAYECCQQLAMPTIAVGAAFDFHAGTLAQAPAAMQRAGLEWLFRLVQEPRRLWRRYLYLNPLYSSLLFLQAAGLRNFEPTETTPPMQELSYG
jgi:exopolysaccharide biosynthesis WecB/TagA/CpsF family protein